MEKAKVTLITHGRFHSFDLAEQLQNVNRLAAIYTGYPRFKLRNTKVSPDHIRCFPWLHTLHLALMRIPHFPESMTDEVAWAAGRALDLYAAKTMPKSNVISALSGSGLRAGTTMQQRGGIYVCDRGSTHIRWVERTLREEHAKLGLPWGGIDSRAVEREEMEYARADAITLPSRFTMRTFVEMGISSEKLRVVPYGVNLASFKRSAERSANFRVLFVGQLSVRKGIHYLLEAFQRAHLSDAELVLVGSPQPQTNAILARYPSDRLTLTGALTREGVVREMSKASVLVLPSIEEGLAMVQAQALACGCPVIATTNAGAEDLFTDGNEGFIIPPRDPGILADRLTRLYDDRNLREAMSVAAEACVRAIGGWDSYGRTSMRVFDELLAAKRSRVAVPAAS